MNLFLYNRMHLALFSFLMFAWSQVNSTPQTVSFWKKREIGSGQVVIFHNNYMMEDREQNHFSAFENMIEQASSSSTGRKMHVIMANEYLGPCGSFLSNATESSGQAMPFAALFIKFFSPSFHSDAVSFYNVEFRGYDILLPYLFMSYFNDTRKNLILKQYDLFTACDIITFQMLYKNQIAALERYRQEAKEPFKHEFDSIYAVLNAQIENLKTQLTHHYVDETVRMKNYFPDKEKYQFFYHFFFGSQYTIFMSEMIQAHVMYRMAQISPQDTILVVINLSNADDLEKRMVNLGYGCIRKILPLTNFPDSLQTMCLVQPGDCDVCGNVEAEKRCSVCKLACYCSEQCQRKDWPEHKKTCKAP